MTANNNIAIATKVHLNLIELEFLQVNKTLTLAEVQYGWTLAKELDESRNSFVLLKTGQWTLLEKEASQFVLAEMKLWPAVAVIVHNSAQKILGSVGFGIIGQSHKLKVFTKQQDALNWLQGKMTLA